jgi:hypothetical protein
MGPSKLTISTHTIRQRLSFSLHSVYYLFLSLKSARPGFSGAYTNFWNVGPAKFTMCSMPTINSLTYDEYFATMDDLCLSY